MRIKRLAALSLAAVFTAAMLTGCPWDKNDAGPSDLPDSSSRPSHDSNDDNNDDDSSSAPSSPSTPDEPEITIDANGTLQLPEGTTTLSPTDIEVIKNQIVTVELTNIDVSPNTFAGCNSLETVNITDGTLDSGEENGGPFKNCQNLETVTLDGVTIKGHGTFWNCKKLETVTLSNITIENDVESTFHSCSKLTTVTGANTLKTIPESMFASCFSLQNIDVSRATSIGENAFGGCNSLKHIRVGTGLTSIGNHAFIAYVNSGDGIVVSPMKLTVHCIGQKDQNNDLETKFSSAGSYADGYPQFTYNCDSDCWNKIVNENQPDGSDAGDALARHFGLMLPL